MKLIPAVDLSEGKCVRLTRGDISEKTVYSDGPVELIKSFSNRWVDLVHIVDLDSAIEIGENQSVIEKIVKETDLDIQLGGGIRTLNDIEKWLSIGVKRVVIGTMALKSQALVEEAIQKFGPERIVVAIDVVDNFVAVHGWKEITNIKADEFASKMGEIGIIRFLYTDIKKDGTLDGISLNSIRYFASKLESAKLIVSGGISGYDDILKLKTLQSENIEGVIIGKAMYEGRIDIKKAALMLKD